MLSAQEPRLRARLLLFWGAPARVRVSVYIDGFNLYYAIRHRGFKWLDLRALARAALPAGTPITRINYYTARVSGAVDPTSPARQQVYLNALSGLPEVKFYFGSFLAKDIWRPVLNLPIAGRDVTYSGTLTCRFAAGAASVAAEQGNAKSRVESLEIGKYGATASTKPSRNAVKANVFAMEEKGSDVNLAVHLVNDAWAGSFDAAAVLSNDTDLVEPIRIVTQERKLPVYLLCAHQRGASKPLAAVATSVRHIRDAHLRSSLFPDPTPDSKGRAISKPSGW